MKKSIFILCLLLLVGCSNTPSIKNQQEEGNNKLEPVIYEKIEHQNSWAFDVSNPEEMVNNSDVVLKVKVTGVDQTGKFISKNSIPATGISVEIVEILVGKLNQDITKIYQWGGFVTIKDAIENNSEAKSIKAGWTTLSEEQQTTEYIHYSRESFYDVEIGKEYIVALLKGSNDDYYLGADGYDVFIEETNTRSSGVTIKNVVTNNTTIID